MPHKLAEFVDRDPELALFEHLLRHPDERVLLLYGVQGIGETWLINYLRRQCMERQLPCVLIDFRQDDRLAEEPCAVMRKLCQEIGGEFAQHLLAVEQRLRISEFALDVSRDIQEAASHVESVHAQSAGSGATIAGSVRMEGNSTLVGRDQININVFSPLIDPAAGPRLAEASLEQYWSVEIRSALRQYLRQNRLLLFFDHFENAKSAVAQWLRRDVLALHVDEFSEDYRNLWVTVAGRSVPLQGQIDSLAPMVQGREIGPLPKDAIQIYWVNKRGLNAVILDLVIRLSGGNPQILYFMAQNECKAEMAEDSRA